MRLAATFYKHPCCTCLREFFKFRSHGHCCNQTTGAVLACILAMHCAGDPREEESPNSPGKELCAVLVLWTVSGKGRKCFLKRKHRWEEVPLFHLANSFYAKPKLQCLTQDFSEGKVYIFCSSISFLIC